jgi:hypothetical protein
VVARKSSTGQERRRQPVAWWQSHAAGVGPSRVSERASRGKGLRKMEGIPGRLSGRSFTRAVLKTVLAALRGQVRASVTCLAGDATGVSEARCARIVTGRKRPRDENGR